MRQITTLFILYLVSFSVISQWYQTQGQAYIRNGDKEAAKIQAMENALKKALLVSGASVSSVKQVVNGLLTQDEINIRAIGSVNAFELIDEIHQGDTISVTIQADIFPQEKQCFAADYKKTMLITRGHLEHREQANIGGIYALDTVISKHLSNELKKQAYNIQTKLALKNKTGFSRYNASYQTEAEKQITMALANMTDSQYILFSEITDLSFSDQINNSWQFWQQDIKDRFFDLSVYLFDGSNGELLFTNSYRNSAPWQYKKREQVDVNGKAFWQTDYGRMINHTLATVSKDIDENIMCLPAQGKIIRVTNNHLTINLGKYQGVKVGDEFTLLLSNNFTANNGKHYAGYNVSPHKIKITKVTQDTAQAITTDKRILGNIQVNDIAVRY